MKWRAAGETLLSREECEHSSQGEKVADGRCGRTIEAKPVSDQTCLIEPAEGMAYDSGGRNLVMALAVRCPDRTARPRSRSSVSKA